MLLRTHWVIRIALPRLIKSLEEEHRYVVVGRPGLELVVIACLVRHVGTLTEFARCCCPARLENRVRLVGVLLAYASEVLERITHCLIDRLFFPLRVGVNADEIDGINEFGPVLGPPDVIVSDGNGLRDRCLHATDVANYGFDRNHVIVPVDQRLVADVDGDNDVIVFVREAYTGLQLSLVSQRIGVQFRLRDRLVEPRTAFMVAELGPEPHAQQDFHWQLVLANQAQGRLRVDVDVVHAQQGEAIVDQDLQILEYLGVGRVDGAIAAIRVLALAIAGIGHRHDLARDQICRVLSQVAIHAKRDIGVSRMVVFIKCISKQSVVSNRWGFKDCRRRRCVFQQPIDILRDFFAVPADGRGFAFRFDFPAVAQRVAIGIPRIEYDFVVLPRDQRDVIRRALTIKSYVMHLWRAVVRPIAGPGSVQDVDSFGDVTVLGEYPKPRRRAFLLLAPDKRIRPDQVVGNRREFLGVTTPEHVGFLGACLFERCPPRGLVGLPVTDCAPLRHHEGRIEPGSREQFGQSEQAAVDLEAEEIEIRRALTHNGDILFVETGQRRRRRMIWVELVNHLRDLVHRVVNGVVFSVEVELVADDPGQQGRMIAVLENLLPHRLELRLYRSLVVIIESPSLSLQRQAKRYRHAVGVRFVEQRTGTLLVFDIRRPVANRVAAMRYESFEVVKGHAGAANLVRLPIPP